MTRVHRLGWAALAIATLAIAVIPDLVTLPEPDATIVLDHGTYLPDNGSGGEVSLPHAIYPRISGQPDLVRYEFSFDLPAPPDRNLFVFIPSINRRVSLALNGEPFSGLDTSEFWAGAMVSSSVMVRLPRRELAAGRNRLTVMVEFGPFAAPTYLSRIYLGTEDAVASNHKLRSFLSSQLKTMALAAQVLLGVGLIVAYFFRPKDPLFSWLALFLGLGFFVTMGLFIGWQPKFQFLLPLTVVLTPALGFLYVGVALALINKAPPRALRLSVIVVPIVFLIFLMTDTARIISAMGIAAILTASFVGAAGIMAWGAFRPGNTDARLMLAPSFVLAWYAVRDVYVTATLPEHAFNLLVPYPRPLWLAFFTAVLMRRMGVSLDQFDRANETLAVKLAQREAELAALYRQEQVEATRQTREHERRRLTHDLHDGLSGHLVSIIALSERSGEKPTEQAARDALSDLRLVIYSLDLGDRELPLALANFRERLVPQLHRLGIELDWSIANLPDVSGVTPGNALAVLRILQEAVTNAIKHGPARKLSVRGTTTAGGLAAIVVENDGTPYVEGHRGRGLDNMRRRAGQLESKLDLEATANGMRVTLLLPLALPDFEENAAG